MASTTTENAEILRRRCFNNLVLASHVVILGRFACVMNVETQRCVSPTLCFLLFYSHPTRHEKHKSISRKEDEFLATQSRDRSLWRQCSDRVPRVEANPDDELPRRGQNGLSLSNFIFPSA